MTITTNSNPKDAQMPDPLRQLRDAARACADAGIAPSLVTAEVAAVLRDADEVDDPLQPRDAFVQLVDALPGVEPEARAALAKALRSDVDRIARKAVSAAALRRAQLQRSVIEDLGAEARRAVDGPKDAPLSRNGHEQR